MNEGSEPEPAALPRDLAVSHFRQLTISALIATSVCSGAAWAGDPWADYRNNSAFTEKRASTVEGVDRGVKPAVGKSKVDKKVYDAAGGEVLRPGQTSVAVHGYMQVDVGARAR